MIKNNTLNSFNISSFFLKDKLLIFWSIWLRISSFKFEIVKFNNIQKIKIHSVVSICFLKMISFHFFFIRHVRLIFHPWFCKKGWKVFSINYFDRKIKPLFGITGLNDFLDNYTLHLYTSKQQFLNSWNNVLLIIKAEFSFLVNFFWMK